MWWKEEPIYFKLDLLELTNLDKYEKMKADSFYKRVMKFVQSEDLNDLFPNCI